MINQVKDLQFLETQVYKIVKNWNTSIIHVLVHENKMNLQLHLSISYVQSGEQDADALQIEGDKTCIHQPECWNILTLTNR